MVTPRKARQGYDHRKSDQDPVDHRDRDRVSFRWTGSRRTPPTLRSPGQRKIYAYVYTGDGATAAKQRGLAGRGDDRPERDRRLQQTDLYKHVVPDNLAKARR